MPPSAGDRSADVNVDAKVDDVMEPEAPAAALSSPPAGGAKKSKRGLFGSLSFKKKPSSKAKIEVSGGGRASLIGRQAGWLLHGGVSRRLCIICFLVCGGRVVSL